MLSLLAQTSAPATAPDLSWIPTTEHAWRGALFAASILIVGLLLYIALRNLLHRARLIPAYFILLISLALYFGLATLEPQRLLLQDDPFTYWLNRACAAALLFVALRLIDRLLIIPVLSRGGTSHIPRFIHQLIQIVLALFAILIFGSLAFGWEIDKFLAGSAVVSIVLGLALQESLGNLFSGLVMQASPPFSIGDFVNTGGVEGIVVDMTWRAVTIRTNDDNYVVVPNGNIAKQDIINFNAPTAATARMVKIGLEYDLPPCDALDVLKAAALETPEVLHDPAPLVIMLDFADSAILYGIKFWIGDPHKHMKIEHDVRLHVWYRLKQNGYGIPFPMRTVEHTTLREKTEKTDAAALTARAAAIRNVPLLAPLTPEQHQQLAVGATDLHLAPGQILFHQNTAGDSFYVIRQGSAEVLIHTENTTATVATLNPGDFFGEMSALTGQPRTATIRAASPLALVQITKPDLQALIDADPTLLEKLSLIIATRNAEREAIMKGLAATAANPETVQTQQKSLLTRMLRFFRTTLATPTITNPKTPLPE